jgi:DNA-binding MarR family transcriptional regulator
MAWDGFDHPLYVDLLVDEIGGQFAGKPMTVGAMISTLCEKGLGERETTRRDGRKCTSFALTEMGQAVAIDLGL